jgi:hypothetical protein
MLLVAWASAAEQGGSRKAQRRLPIREDWLSRALLENDDADGGDKDSKITGKPTVLDIVQIVGELFPGVFYRSAVGIVNLGPAGDARLYLLPLSKQRDCGR